jgi:AcrR family transcriptional regulator
MARMTKPDLHPARRLGENEDDARRRLLAAAERCIERHGIRKTTMDDVAREAGISRPSVYRYFSDREELLLSVTAERSRALVRKTQRFLARQPSFADAIVNGLLYLADHGRRDAITRHLTDPSDSAFSARLASTHTQETLTSEFWREYLTAAQASGEMDPELDLDDVHLWLGNLGLMLMSWMERAPEAKAQHRRVIETLVLPGLVNRQDGDAGARNGVPNASTG